MTRYITLWRKPDAVLDWDSYVSEDRREAETVLGNLRKQNVRQAHTYELGALQADLSITWNDQKGIPDAH